MNDPLPEQISGHLATSRDDDPVDGLGPPPMLSRSQLSHGQADAKASDTTCSNGHEGSRELVTLESLASRIRHAHHRATKHGEAAVQSAVECGHGLIGAKARLGHGQFGRWLESEIKISRRTAQGYMQLARALAKLPQPDARRVAHLGLRGAIAAIAREAASQGAHEAARAATPSRSGQAQSTAARIASQGLVPPSFGTFKPALASPKDGPRPAPPLLEGKAEPIDGTLDIEPIGSRLDSEVDHRSSSDAGEGVRGELGVAQPLNEQPTAVVPAKGGTTGDKQAAEGSLPLALPRQRASFLAAALITCIQDFAARQDPRLSADQAGAALNEAYVRLRESGDKLVRAKVE